MLDVDDDDEAYCRTASVLGVHQYWVEHASFPKQLELQRSREIIYELYALAEKAKMYQLANKLMDLVIEGLLVAKSSSAGPNVRIMEQVFNFTIESSKLRTVFVDNFIWRVSDRYIDDHEKDLKAAPGFSTRMFLQLRHTPRLRLKDDPQNPIQAHKMCAYHYHSEEEKAVFGGKFGGTCLDPVENEGDATTPTNNDEDCGEGGVSESEGTEYGLETGFRSQERIDEGATFNPDEFYDDE